MRPSTYYFIKSFPRLASGKIDRNLIVNNKNLIEITEKTSQLEERKILSIIMCKHSSRVEEC